MMWDNILLTIINNIAKLIPIRLPIIYDYQQGAKFSFGKAKKNLGPGIHFHWAWVQNVMIVDTVDQVVETNLVTTTTKNKKPLSLSISINYKINDAVAYYTGVQDFDVSLIKLAEGVLTSVASRFMDDEIYKDHGVLTQAVMDELDETCSSWGVELLEINLSNIVEATTYRILADNIAQPIIIQNS